MVGKKSAAPAIGSAFRLRRAEAFDAVECSVRVPAEEGCSALAAGAVIAERMPDR
jgi:hypothetical protein